MQRSAVIQRPRIAKMPWCINSCRVSAHGLLHLSSRSVRGGEQSEDRGSTSRATARARKRDLFRPAADPDGGTKAHCSERTAARRCCPSSTRERGTGTEGRRNGSRGKQSRPETRALQPTIDYYCTEEFLLV
eukprot:3154639-Rhodomonas_salina.1